MSVRRELRRVHRWQRYYWRYRVTTVAPPGFERAWGRWQRARNRAFDLRAEREAERWRSRVGRYE